MDPVFGKQGVEQHFHSMCLAANSAIESLKHKSSRGESFNLLDFSVRATLHAILMAMFSHESDLFALRVSEQTDMELSRVSKTILEESVMRAYLPKSVKKVRGDAGWQDAAKIFQKRLGSIIDERREPDAKAKHDILQQMIQGGMPGDESDDEINHLIHQLSLLIIAGHETNGSSIAYIFDTIARHPDIQMKIAAEAQEAGLGDDLSKVNSDAVKQLKYTDMVISESMRLNPPATALLRIAREDCTVMASTGNKFEIKKGDSASVLISSLHHNPLFWPELEQFKPERFTPQEKKTRHSYAYLPFAAGARGCLGRMFAMQELRLFVAAFTLRFHFIPCNSSTSHYYGLTMKPLKARVKIIPRTVDLKLPASVATSTISPSQGPFAKEARKMSTISSPSSEEDSQDEDGNLEDLPRVQIAYGSAQGDARSMAYHLNAILQQMGFETEQLCTLNNLSIEDTFVQNSLLFIVTSTYNGDPPDNATSFRDSLQGWLKQDSRPCWQGNQFTVFGAGNSEWRIKFHAFPNYVDECLDKLQSSRLFPMGGGNAEEDMDADWKAWLFALVASLAETYNLLHNLTPDMLQSIHLGTSCGNNTIAIATLSGNQEKEQANQFCNATISRVTELQDCALLAEEVR